MRQYGVCQQEPRYPGPIDCRQRNHLQIFRKRRIGQPGADGHDSQGGHRHVERGPAVEKRPFSRPDDVDDQRLGQQRFHEPPCLK